MSKPSKVVLYMFVAVVAIVIAAMFLPDSPAFLGGTPPQQMSLSKFIAEVRAKDVDKIEWRETTIGGIFKNSKFRFEVANVPEVSTAAGTNILREMDNAGINYVLKPRPISSLIVGIFPVIFFPLIVIAIIYFLVLRPIGLNNRR